MDTHPVTIGILSRRRFFRESLGCILKHAGFEVIPPCEEVDDFIARVKQDSPTVALVDLWIENPERSEPVAGFRALELLHDFLPHIRPLVLSVHWEPELVERSLRAGASGFLDMGNMGCAEVVEAVARVASGEQLIPQDFVLSNLTQQQLSTPGVLDRLTARERQVLGFIAIGADNLKIAACLGIAERTVKSHVTSIYRKLDVENRTQMAMLACQLGVGRPALWS